MFGIAGEVENSSDTIHPANEIFVVDDNEEYRGLLAAVLELEGFQITTFPEGTSFLKEAASRVPVCVFLDVVMPGPSGLEVLKILDAKAYAAPIFLISARPNSRAIVEAMRSGARDFIEKPFDPYTAVLRVRDAVDIWARRASRAKAPRLPALHLPKGIHLSQMEHEVLAYIVAGAPNGEVAEALDITRQSVANHRWRITKKLGARSSADLVRIVLSKSQAQSAAF